MPSNLYLEMADAIAAARIRLQLIREGLLVKEGDELGSGRQRRMSRVRDQEPVIGAGRKGPPPPFHIPATRSHRLSNSAGATSFHFAHRAVSKVTFTTLDEGLRNKPGAARAHGRYIEREDAIAILEPAIGVAEPATMSAAIDGEPATTITIQAKDHHHDDIKHQWLDRGLAGQLVAGFAAAEPGSEGPLLGRPVEDAFTDAGLRLLSRRDLVRHRRGADGVLLGAQDVSVAAGANPLGLRQPSAGDRARPGIDIPSLRSAGDAAAHDDYIGRPGAVAIQPNGTRALLTNIDGDDDARAAFWSLVEQHEAVSQGDKISFRIADAPAFWSAVLATPDCPPELSAAITAAKPSEIVKVSIPSGKAMREYLARQPGWVPLPKRRKAKAGPTPLAKFHDGRAGRTQYRIVGELPDELDPAARFAILCDFTKEITKRNLPFVAVMHAPDHTNDERNWHFHLIYYDRPCRRITAEDIQRLKADGYRADHLTPGMWDFTVVTPKKGRSNGRAVPLIQNKVGEVSQDDWIPKLRRRFAAITNQHLSRAGIQRRLDPRRHEEMGIIADPQEHLGSAQAAAETKGQPTKIGSENEARQWDAIMRQADEQLALALAQIDEAPADGVASRGAGVIDEEDRQRRIEAARLDHMAFCLDQEIDRARSRARAIQRRNRQLVEAYIADPLRDRIVN